MGIEVCREIKRTLSLAGDYMNLKGTKNLENNFPLDFQPVGPAWPFAGPGSKILRGLNTHSNCTILQRKIIYLQMRTLYVTWTDFQN